MASLGETILINNNNLKSLWKLTAIAEKIKSMLSNVYKKDLKKREYNFFERKKTVIGW